MWHCRVDESTTDKPWDDAAAEQLRHGRVLAYPTDTLYGLAADPRQPAAIQALYRIKGRAADLAIPLIAADEAQLAECGATLQPVASRLATRFWPGPLTLVIPAWKGLSPALLAGGLSVAVRVPDHPVARTLARVFGHPITSTSANRSGQPPTCRPEDVMAHLGSVLDGLIDAGPSPGGPASTIVDVTGPAPRLIRAGAVPWERVLEFLT